MKTARVYWKIFLCFLAVLVVTEILVFGLFMATAGRTFRDRFYKYAEAIMVVNRGLVTQQLAAAEHDGVDQAESLRDSLAFLGRAYDAKFWLSRADDGSVLAKSFEGAPPGPASHRPRGDAVHRGEVTIQSYHDVGLLAHVSAPISLGQGDPAVLNAFFSETSPDHPPIFFGLGLLVIGVVVALLVMPVSRLITRRLNVLRESALRIAAGDLDHRAVLKGKDEVAELGAAFNHMADKVQAMVESGRELTANLSHELRSPLARIRVAQEMMHDTLQRGGTQRLDDHLDRIQEDIERLDHLIGRMLELSKIDLHQKNATREPIDLAAMIRGLLDSFAASAKVQELELNADLTEKAPPINGDPEGLSTALTNLLDNAIRYTPGGGRVTVHFSKQDRGVAVEVINTHPPLSPSDLAGMFEPFVRLDEAATSGYGMGLAISKRIIERHGGSMKAANTPEGLSIMVSLPA
jgi:two-component system sensor histidine kinase CpxA